MKYIIENEILTGISLSDEDPPVLKIPDGVKVIDIRDEDNNLWSVLEMKTIYLPHSVEKIYAYPFGLDTILRDLYYDGTLREWCAVEKGWHDAWGQYVGLGCRDYGLHLRDEDGRYFLVQNLLIDDIPEIGPCSFYGCASLRSVEIRNALVGADAFCGCRNLERVYLYGPDLELEASDYSGEMFPPFDDREDLCLHFSEEAMDSEFGGDDSSCLNLQNPVLLAETDENILEFLDHLRELEDDFFTKNGLYPDSRLSEKYHFLRSLAQEDDTPLFDRYDDEATDDCLPFSSPETAGHLFMEEDKLSTDTSDSVLSHLYSLLLGLRHKLEEYRKTALPVLRQCSGFKAGQGDRQTFEGVSRKMFDDIESLSYETGDLEDDVSSCLDDIDFTGEEEGVQSDLVGEIYDLVEDISDTLDYIDDRINLIYRDLSDIVDAFDDPCAFTERMTRALGEGYADYGDLTEELAKAWAFPEKTADINENSAECAGYMEDAVSAVERAVDMIC